MADLKKRNLVIVNSVGTFGPFMGILHSYRYAVKRFKALKLCYTGTVVDECMELYQYRFCKSYSTALYIFRTNDSMYDWYFLSKRN